MSRGEYLDAYEIMVRGLSAGLRSLEELTRRPAEALRDFPAEMHRHGDSTLYLGEGTSIVCLESRLCDTHL